MRRALPLSLVLIFLCACQGDRTVPAGEREPDMVTRAEAAAGELARRLKTRLMQAMGSEGPVAAIGICSEEAAAIAVEVSEEYGLAVSRTSLRVRNPANEPEARERAVLELWADRISKGTPPAVLRTFVNEKGQFLWMKPILVEGPCLACHGSAIADDVARAIARRYPADRATGFAEGDLRGAFVVRAFATEQE